MNIKPGSEEEVSKQKTRDRAFLEVVNLPAWACLKELMQQLGRYEKINIEHPQYFQMVAHRNGKMELTLDIIKAVEAGAARAKGDVRQ